MRINSEGLKCFLFILDPVSYPLTLQITRSQIDFSKPWLQGNFFKNSSE